MADNLRSYGPGKYGLVIDGYVHDVTLDGCCEEDGDVETTGWYALVEGGLLTSVVEHESDLTDDERTFLAAQVGAIVSEDSQGFVDVEYYESASDLKAAWDAITAEIAAADAEVN